MNGSLVPGGAGAAAPTSRRCTAPTRCTATWPRSSSLILARRGLGRRGAAGRAQPRLARLAVAILAVYVVQVVVGALQIATPPRAVDADAPRRARRAGLGRRGGARRRRRTTRRRIAARRGRAGEARRPASDGGRRRRPTRAADERRRLGPRLRGADQAADHRAAARHDRPGDGPRDPRGPGHADRRLGAAHVLDARLRDARRGLGERDQPVPRARHRRPHGPDPAPAAAGQRGHAGARGRLRDRPRRDLGRRSWPGP